MIPDADAVAEVFADFPSFCDLLEIRVKDGPAQSFGYSEWFAEQRLFEAHRSGLDIVLKPRQAGFSTLELARDLWYALTHPGSQVLVVVHGKAEGQKLFRTVKIFCDSLSALGLLPPRSYDNVGEVVFKAPLNSSIQIVEAGATESSASKKGRSGTVHRFHATEVAFWDAAVTTMAAIMSCVPANGEVVVESTPNGAGGIFYEDVIAARRGTSGYRLHFFAWFDHAEYRRVVDADFDATPRDEWEDRLRASGCDDEQIAWWRWKVDDPKVGLTTALQEFPIDIDTCFRSSGDAWFDSVHLDRLTLAIREPMRRAPLAWDGHRFPDADIYAEPVAGESYVVFADPAEGVARDGSAACVMHARTGDVVAVWWSDTVEAMEFGAVLALLGWMYNTALVGVERNNHGHAVLLRMRTKEIAYPRLYVAKDGRVGWDTNSATRPVLWADLAHAIRDGAALTPDAETVAECRTIVRDADGRPRARGKGKKSRDSSRDDRYVAWAGCWQIRTSALQTSRSFHVAGL